MIAERLFYYRAIVTKVYDGDTITVDVDLGFHQWSKGIKLRLLGIDAPELRRPTIYEGRAARNFLRSLVLGKPVIIRTSKTGFYKRWLADVWVQSQGEWLNVNNEMVAAGYARFLPPR